MQGPSLRRRRLDGVRLRWGALLAASSTDAGPQVSEHSLTSRLSRLSCVCLCLEPDRRRRCAGPDPG